MKFTFQDGAVATGNGSALAIPVNAASIGVQVSGITTATVIPEGTIDGTNWVAIAMTPVAGGAAVTSATADGAWTINPAGLSAVRVRVSAWTAGTIDAIGKVTY